MHRAHTQQNARNTADRNAILANDPHKAMQEMMDTINNLRGIYVDETEALEKMDTKTFLSLQEEKLSAAQKYQASIGEMLARKEEMRGVDQATKKELERMQADFATLSSKNMKALQRMQRTMERLGNTIHKAAKDSVKKERAFSYGQSGHLDENDKKRVSIGVSETA